MTRAPATTTSQSVSDMNDGMSQQVQTLIDQAGTEALVDERRSRDRFPIPYTFRLTPVDDDGQLLTDETTTIVGKDLRSRASAFLMTTRCPVAGRSSRSITPWWAGSLWKRRSCGRGRRQSASTKAGAG